MQTQKAILADAQNAGFIFHAQINLKNCEYGYQYIYILKKPYPSSK